LLKNHQNRQIHTLSPVQPRVHLQLIIITNVLDDENQVLEKNKITDERTTKLHIVELSRNITDG